MLIWQIFNVLLFCTIFFLVIRLLIIKNFPSSKKKDIDPWIGIPPYPVRIYWRAENNRFIAEVPDLPGCVADGTTQAEALSNAALTTAQWLKTAQQLNRSIPSPNSNLFGDNKM